MMGNLPIGVPPPSMQGLLMQQQMMAAIPTSGASPFPPGTILPPMTVPSGGHSVSLNNITQKRFFLKALISNFFTIGPQHS